MGIPDHWPGSGDQKLHIFTNHYIPLYIYIKGKLEGKLKGKIYILIYITYIMGKYINIYK